MKAIFVNWTAPFFYKNDAQGYNKLKMVDLPDDEYQLVDYELLIQKVAVKRAKKHIGKTKLYTDNIGYAYYKKMGMIKFWDEIDTETLENFNTEYSNISPGRFWTTGKSIVMGKEPIPYVFVDLDFIIRSPLPKWLFNYDLVHTQWEIQRGEFFVFEHQVNEIGGIEDFVQNMMVPNTSFVFMNNEELRDLYYKKHIDIISRKYDEVPEWLWLIADQGLLGYSARKLNSKVETIENRIYLSYPELPLDNQLVGKGLFWVKDPNRIDHKENLDYEHIWFTKHALKTYENYRISKMCELQEELDKLTPKII
jgi:hypothetical protein